MTARIISTERFFKGRIIEVERDILRDDEGREMVREVVRHPGGAGGLPLFDDGTVALVRQYRHPAGRELLEIPAGRIEPGEDPESCARREIESEIGYRPERLEKLSEFFSTPGFCEERIFVYLATGLVPSEQALDEDEVVEIVRLPLEQALSLVHRGEIEDAKTIIALALAAGPAFDLLSGAPQD